MATAKTDGFYWDSGQTLTSVELSNCDTTSVSNLRASVHFTDGTSMIPADLNLNGSTLSIQAPSGSADTFSNVKAVVVVQIVA
tara:strand:- start:1150 stop:1398 length:249 start_codon:yes stop_codon:yes gene_type:complete